MKTLPIFFLLAVLLGFLIGFVWGTGTRDASDDATEIDFADGVLTVRYRAFSALAAGFQSLFR